MLLGYQPAESLVVCALHGPRHAVGLTMRFDLDAFDDLDGAADELAHRLEITGADGAFVAVFTEQRSSQGRLPYAELVAAIVKRSEVGMKDAVLVRRGRWWSYLCRDVECCPKAGRRIVRRTEELNRLQTALVLSGNTVLADRATLVESVAFDRGIDVAAQRRRILEAQRAVAGAPAGACRAELRELVRRLAARLEDPRAPVDDGEAARFAALVLDIDARDDLLLQAVPPRHRDDVLRVLRAVVRQVPAPYDAPLATVLAWFAYAAGDGTLANIALDRALDTDPGYSLALLIETSLDRQLPPSVLEGVVRGAARDIAARDAAG
jgi:hypothetical protein